MNLLISNSLFSPQINEKIFSNARKTTWNWIAQIWLKNEFYQVIKKNSKWHHLFVDIVSQHTKGSQYNSIWKIGIAIASCIWFCLWKKKKKMCTKDRFQWYYYYYYHYYVVWKSTDTVKLDYTICCWYFSVSNDIEWCACESCNIYIYKT